MKTPKIESFKRIIPMIYAYTTPNDISHQGWTKIGYTDKQTVEDRIYQQTHTADVKTKILWRGNARYQDGSDETFTDHDFHEYLTRYRHIERKPKTEWFHIDGETSHQYFYQFTERNMSDIQGAEHHQYELRQEQQRAVDQTQQYFLDHGAGGEFLWNAKPRFGKTLTTYDLIRQMHLTNVLVVTNRPSIANSWFDDFDKFIAWQTNFKFVSETDALKERPVLSRREFLNALGDGEDAGQIAFESLQGLKGSIYFGGNYDKLKWVGDLEWDLLVIDEAHEGVDTYKTDKAFDKIQRKYTLHLTGTPFKALAEGKFASDQIYNWSYADEQMAKTTWQEDQEGCSNPYEVMPRLNMYTYQMSAMIEEQLTSHAQLEDEDQVNPAFDLNEFFRTQNGKFVYEDDVDRFLDALTTQEKYPFSTPALRQELAHTFWLLNRVDSAKALAKKLKKHPVFGDYEIVVAAGDGKWDDDQLNADQLERATEKSFDKVQKAIQHHEKTITLSVGQLTTGVTIKPWSGVLMLSNMKSPSEYMQAAFRAQNPYTFRQDGELLQKENAYVFDFDPTRTLLIFDEFANNLLEETANGKGTAAEHKANIRELLNFFPVIGEDESGEMVPLDAEQVMSIPRHLKAQEVVNRGFMSNFLFTNISRIFGSPAVVRDILNELTPAKEEKPKHTGATMDQAEDVPVNDQGEVEISKERVIGTAANIFGPKIYDDITSQATTADDGTGLLDTYMTTDDQGNQTVDLGTTDDQGNSLIDFDGTASAITERLNDAIDENIIMEASEQYQLTKSETNRMRKQIETQNKDTLSRIADESKDQKKIVDLEYNKKLESAQTPEEVTQVRDDYQKDVTNIVEGFTEKMKRAVEETANYIPEHVVEHVERRQEEQKKKDIEEDVRAHLRGFSRTIPSFIMAYGDDQLTLANFDDYTEDDVFKEVTGITEEQFRFLRDGGDYLDTEGVTQHFDGHLFDEVVFNDSIQQFLTLKQKLSDYFNEENDEDIFDYIPPQRTNQIYTPKAVVKHMVDDLEANNPGIFGDPTKTFADLYMKSGLYITEIVKRLFNDEQMRALYPNDQARIEHIMEHQVYGLAPTRIIYLIATNYIFGFDEGLKQSVLGKHFQQIDAAEHAKNGTLEMTVKEAFGGESSHI
ncbi:MAG: DEAD/DEAH box helicase family protein [Aerococcus sp.]|nr:DEAD/DEAH box helicase family protein [Aerococcus sp.]